MAKNKNQQHNNAEDYLAQVEWHNQQLQRHPKIPLPWYMEPKWKYKRVLSFKNSSPKEVSALAKIVITIVVLCVGYFLFRNALGLPIVLLIMGILFFFMIRDASKKPKEGDND
jgi:hypothetical protein